MFAESDIEEPDLGTVVPYACQPQHSIPAHSHYLYSSYVPTSIVSPSEYSLQNPLDCNMCRTREEELRIATEAVARARRENRQTVNPINNCHRHRPRTRDNSTNKCNSACSKRPRLINTSESAPAAFLPTHSRLRSDHHSDGCRAGPSRSIERPVDYRYIEKIFFPHISLLEFKKKKNTNNFQFK